MTALLVALLFSDDMTMNKNTSLMYFTSVSAGRTEQVLVWTVDVVTLVGVVSAVVRVVRSSLSAAAPNSGSCH